jgi:hypothetical protein
MSTGIELLFLGSRIVWLRFAFGGLFEDDRGARNCPWRVIGGRVKQVCI